MNGVWSFIKDGEPTGARFTGPSKALAANTPEGCCAVPGIVDAKRNDLESKRARVMASIEELEQKQLRSIAELMTDPGDQQARLHFDRRKSEIVRLRASLAETDTSEPAS